MMVPKRIRFARDKESEYVEFRTETDDTRSYTLHIKQSSQVSNTTNAMYNTAVFNEYVFSPKWKTTIITLLVYLQKHKSTQQEVVIVGSTQNSF